jgi:MFS transporter, ACS family, D-galactonate transporter
VEARNPALTATGLAIWGWIIRIVVFVAYLLVPVVINTVTPLVNYGSTVQAYVAQYPSQFAFAGAHPNVIAAAQKVPPPVLATASSIPPTVAATAQKIPPSVLATAQANATQLANAVKFAPELAVIQAHPALFTKLAAYSNPAKIPPALLGQAARASPRSSRPGCRHESRKPLLMMNRQSGELRRRQRHRRRSACRRR